MFSKTLSNLNFQHSFSMINRFILPKNYYPEHELFLVDLNCEGTEILLQEVCILSACLTLNKHFFIFQANNQSFFRAPYRWLVIKNNDTTYDFFDQFKILVDSNFYIIEEVEPSNYCIKYFYKYSETSNEYSVVDFAMWNIYKRFLYYRRIPPARARFDLNKTLIRISIVVTNPDTINHLMDYRYE